jgi:hypothetical protein
MKKIHSIASSNEFTCVPSNNHFKRRGLIGIEDFIPYICHVSTNRMTSGSVRTLQMRREKTPRLGQCLISFPN